VERKQKLGAGGEGLAVFGLKKVNGAFLGGKLGIGERPNMLTAGKRREKNFAKGKNGGQNKKEARPNCSVRKPMGFPSSGPGLRLHTGGMILVEKNPI